MTDTLPKDIDAERGAIASALAFPDECWPIVSRTRTSDYIDPIFRAIHGSMMRCQQRGEPIAPPLLVPDLKANPLFDDNPAYYLLQLADEVSTSAHAEHFVNRILEKRLARGIIGASEAAINAACNGVGPKVALSELAERIDDLRSQTADNGLLSDLKSIADFMEEESQVEYLVPYFIPAAQPGVISARAKSLKTSVACDLAVSLPTATPVLGLWKIPTPIQCGILSAESGEATLRETIRRIAKSKGIDARSINGSVISTRCPRLQQPEWLDEIRRVIEKNRLRCLIIDPTYLALAGIDQNKLAAVADALAPVGEIIQDTGCSIIMVHHNRKSTLQPYGCPTLEEITGSGFAEWSRFWLLLNKRREWDDLTGEHWLWLSVGGSAGFGSRKWLDVREGKPTDLGGRVWQVEVQAAHEGESQEKQAAARQRQELAAEQRASDIRKIIDAARKLDGHQGTKTELKDRSRVRTSRFNDALADLLDSGDLRSVSIIKANNRKYEGFKLNEE